MYHEKNLGKLRWSTVRILGAACCLWDFVASDVQGRLPVSLGGRHRDRQNIKDEHESSLPPDQNAAYANGLDCISAKQSTSG